ncbi:MAG: caspase family protein [Bacteroidota bacterium]
MQKNFASVRRLVIWLACVPLGQGLWAQTGLVHPKYLKGKTYAVLVGISAYEAPVNKLSISHKDALAMEQFLSLHGFPRLTSAEMRVRTDASATYEQLVNDLIWVAEKAGPDDRIIFFFSGHGSKDGLAPVDYGPTQQILSHTLIKSLLGRSRSRQIIMMADACHSGGMDGAVYLGMVTDMVQGYRNSGITMLLSSSHAQTSLEYAAEGLSFFTYYFLQGVLGGYADKNGDKMITVQESFDYTRLNVQVMTEGRQTPQLAGDIDPSIVFRIGLP